MQQREGEFIETLWEFYASRGRDLPWRQEPFSAYRILVSEFMLQQTQVRRVIPKYQQFLSMLPTISDLADASLSTVLTLWQGLGYNRRAKYLHDAAKQLISVPEPWTLAELVACKGLGHNTAAAVLTYTYNQPYIFIETNIRTVYIHHFFAGYTQPVNDKQLIPLLETTLDAENPRYFYWALMDYGTFLKRSTGNAAQLSSQYKQQSAFAGSNRQLRGQVLRLLSQRPRTERALTSKLTDKRLAAVLAELQTEGLICLRDRLFSLAD